MNSILIVDDIADNLRYLQSLLSGAGYDVRIATSGEMAIKAVTKIPPSMILMDINMPSMNGYEACKIIKQLPTCSHIPVIFISANTGTEQICNAFDAGGCDYITKPFSHQEVMTRIKNQFSLMATRSQQQQAKLQSAVAQMTVGIAHEINTPLGVCITANSFLMEQIQMLPQPIAELTDSEPLQLLVESGGEITTMLQKNLQRVCELINAFKMLAQGSSHDDIEIVDLAKLVALVQESYRNELSALNIDLVVSCEAVSLQTSARFILKVLELLIENSIHHAFSGPCVSTPTIEILLAQRDQVQIIYRDNGHGMSSDVINKLFEPFYTSKRSEGHIGLSASVLFNIVTLGLGGEISVKVGKQGGLEFQINLPNHLI